MKKKELMRRMVLLAFACLIPMIMSTVATNVMVQAVILPIQELITELDNQYQMTCQEALNMAAIQSVQSFLLEAKLLYSCNATTLMVLLIHAVSTAIGGVVGHIVCEGPLSDCCTDELWSICYEHDATTADIAETILVGIATLLCVYLLLRSKLSAFL